MKIGIIIKIFYACESICYFREVGLTEEMSYIDLQPTNGLSERFLLGGSFCSGTLSSKNGDRKVFPGKTEEGVLKKYTSYQITVTPYNKQGMGPSSNAVVATTLEDGKKLIISFYQQRRSRIKA